MESINVRDPSFREFRNKHASSCLCETRSIRCCAGIGGDAAFVRVGEVRAVGGVDEGRRLNLGDLFTSSEGMQPHLVVSDQVHAFEGIDFT